jgi:hypothetical protein
MKSLTVVSEDKVGLLADISFILAKSNINIEAIDFDVVGKKALVTLTVADSDLAKNALNSSGYKVTDDNCLMIKLSDKPGEFNKVASMLSHEGINIEKVHLITKEGKRTILSISVDKPESAARILDDYLASGESSF